MKILITGGTGYVGSHVVQQLVGQDHEVTIFSRRSQALPIAVEWIMGDLSHGLPNLAGYEVLIHNAIVWSDASDELELMDVRCSARLFDSAGRAGVRQVVYTSSTAVHRPFQPQMDETSPIRTDDYYGSTKASGELFLSASAEQFGFCHTILRPSMVVGKPAFPGQQIKVDRRFEAMFKSAISGQAIKIVKGDGRQFTPAVELGRAVMKVVRSPQRGVGGVFLCMGAEVITWEEIAQKIVRTTNSRSKIVTEGNTVPPRFDVQRMHRELDLSFEYGTVMDEHIELLAAQLNS
jgi:UDP-glucose 4-epimerase